jgi:hypothetical protein
VEGSAQSILVIEGSHGVGDPRIKRERTTKKDFKWYCAHLQDETAFQKTTSHGMSHEADPKKADVIWLTGNWNSLSFSEYS